MTQDKFAELVNREIDGLNSPRESEELRAYVQTNTEAKELYQDLIRLSAVLNRVEEVDPPASLTSDIMGALRQPAARPQRAKSTPSWIMWMREAIESRTTFQYAYVFAAGLILGVAIYSLVGVYPTTSSVVDPSSVSGSIIIDNSTYPFNTGPGFQFDLQDAAISGSVQSKYSQNLSVIELDFRSVAEVEIAVSYSPSMLHFKGYSQTQPGTSNHQLSENAFRVTTHGENRYILALERISQVPSQVSITVAKSGNQLYEKSILIGEKGEKTQ